MKGIRKRTEKKAPHESVASNHRKKKKQLERAPQHSHQRAHINTPRDTPREHQRYQGCRSNSLLPPSPTLFILSPHMYSIFVSGQPYFRLRACLRGCVCECVVCARREGWVAAGLQEYIKMASFPARAQKKDAHNTQNKKREKYEGEWDIEASRWWTVRARRKHREEEKTALMAIGEKGEYIKSADPLAAAEPPPPPAVLCAGSPFALQTKSRAHTQARRHRKEARLNATVVLVQSACMRHRQNKTQQAAWLT